MRILITGASGFLGGYIQDKLRNESVITLGRKNADIICDLSKEIPVIPAVDLVIHCAGKAHVVPESIQEKEEFFNVNVKGTRNLLEGIKLSNYLPGGVVYISSVSVYGVESGNLITEENPLLASDAYGLSKIQTEQLIINWCLENGNICTVLRLPLLVGTNPPGNLGSMIKGILKGYYFNISGSSSKKSMVMAKDVADFILKVGTVGGVYNLTDGVHPTFNDLSANIAKQLNKKKPLNMPLVLAKLIAFCGDYLGDKFPLNSRKLKKITSDLTFDDRKARYTFGWEPKPVLENWVINK